MLQLTIIIATINSYYYEKNANYMVYFGYTMWKSEQKSDLLLSPLAVFLAAENSGKVQSSSKEGQEKKTTEDQQSSSDSSRPPPPPPPPPKGPKQGTEWDNPHKSMFRFVVYSYV